MIPDEVPDISPGEMPKASDWNNLKQWAQRDIPKRFIDQAGGGGGTSLFQMARLISDLPCGGTASAQPQEYVDGVGYMDDLSKVPIDVYDTTLSSGGFADGSVVQYQTSDGKNWVVDMPCLSQME